MSKYTIEVYSLLKDKNFKIFDFEYDFYTTNQDVKTSFESSYLAIVYVFLDYGCFLSSDSIDGFKLPFNMSFIIEAGLVNDFNFRYIDISSSLLALNSIGIINLFGIYFLLFI